MIFTMESQSLSTISRKINSSPQIGLFLSLKNYHKQNIDPQAQLVYRTQKLRICVYDNLANNAYIITKLLRKTGYDAELGLNPYDIFPMSQPAWEELDFEMPLDQFANKSIAGWLEFEREKGWKRPDWIRYIGSPSSRGKIWKENLMTAVTHTKQTLYALARSRKGFYSLGHTFLNLTRIRDLSRYDFVVGFGVGPSLAYLAGVKYASVPYGGDLLIIPFQTDDANWRTRERAKLQRIAYQKSEITLVGADPAYLDALKRIGAFQNLYNVTFPVDPIAYAPSRSYLEELIEPQVARRAAGKIVMLVPSRVDFQVKGTDKVLKAFARLVRERKDVFLIMLGWGADLEKAKSLVSELGIAEHTYIYPYVVSKRKLVKLINAADIILDQFSLSGAYGTTTMETMACGKPLITHIDWDKLKALLPEEPPIVNAKTEEHIFQGMTVLCNSESREKVGKAARSWILSNHSERNFSELMKVIIARVQAGKPAT